MIRVILVPIHLKLCLLVRENARPHHRVDVPKFTFSGDVRAMQNMIISELVEIDGNGNIDEPWMCLKVSITKAWREQLGKTKWTKKNWISPETLSRDNRAGNARLRNEHSYRNLRETVLSTGKQYWYVIADLMRTAAAVEGLGKLFGLIRSASENAQL